MMSGDENLSSTEYESKDINLKALSYVTLGVVMILIAIVLLLKPAFSFRVADHVVMTPNQEVIANFSHPRLQSDPVRDWQVFHAAQERILKTYGWVDRNRGIVRIPIAEAMDMYIRQQNPSPDEE